jgi:hypothetical protein
VHQDMKRSSGLQYQIRRSWSRLTVLATHYLSALSYRSSAFAWRANDMLARAAGKLRGLESADSAAFVKIPFSDGRLPLNVLERLKSVILSGPDVEFCSDDHAPGYAFNPGTRVGSTRYHRIDEKQTLAIAAAIDNVASQITRKLGSGWRVINVRSWSLQSGNVGSDGWHVDCFPPSTFKLMLYLNPVGRETGTTEPPRSWRAKRECTCCSIRTLYGIAPYHPRNRASCVQSSR